MNSHSSKKIYITKKQSLFIALITLIIVLIIAISINTNNNKENKTVESTTDNQTTIDNSTQETTQGIIKESDDSRFLELVNQYYSALSTCNMKELEKYVDNMANITAESIKSQMKYIEAYDNIECYVEPGISADTYIVYVKYGLKLINVTTPLPSIDKVFVIYDSTNDAYFVHNITGNTEIEAYISALSQKEYITKLYGQVETELQAALNSDENLKQIYTLIKEVVEKN